MAINLGKLNLGGGNKPVGGGTSVYDNTRPTSPVTPVHANTGARDVEQVAADALANATGLVPLAFYSATNASGQMFRAGAAAAISITLPFRAQLRALTVAASAADTGTYTVYRDGVATSGAVSLSADTAETETFPIDAVPFTEGQTLDVRASGVSSANPVEVIAWLSLDTSTVL